MGYVLKRLAFGIALIGFAAAGVAGFRLAASPAGAAEMLKALYV